MEAIQYVFLLVSLPNSRPCSPRWRLKNYRVLPQCCQASLRFQQAFGLLKNTRALTQLVCQVSLTAALNLFHGDCETPCTAR